MNGETLKYLRYALNLSQVELAQLVGVSHLTIWRYEHNKQQAQPKTLRRLHQALRYTEEDLVEINELLTDESNSRRHARLKTKLQEQAISNIRKYKTIKQ